MRGKDFGQIASLLALTMFGAEQAAGGTQQRRGRPWIGRKRGHSSRIKHSEKWFEDGEPKTQKTLQETALPIREADGYYHPMVRMRGQKDLRPAPWWCSEKRDAKRANR